ncbi:helix-turn-helix domain-containing protein [Streptosporangium sandarakinum]|uniref:helix-turn-helix domain-containing protein n=1 Tax=Streptosporangium sandarakinum TaxID=1260955 RepID=UPI0036C3A225
MTGPWTMEAIKALGPTTNVETAASVLDVSTWLAYELIRRGEWPTRALRLGRKIRIPTHDLVELLYPQNTNGARSATDLAAATINTDPTIRGNDAVPDRTASPQSTAAHG